MLPSSAYERQNQVTQQSDTHREVDTFDDFLGAVRIGSDATHQRAQDVRAPQRVPCDVANYHQLQSGALAKPPVVPERTAHVARAVQPGDLRLDPTLEVVPQ